MLYRLLVVALGLTGGLLGAGGCALTEQAELALLGLEAEAKQTLDCLLTGGVLGLADDATGLGLHELLASQTTGGAPGGAMEYLCLAAACLHGLCCWCHFCFLPYGAIFFPQVRVQKEQPPCPSQPPPSPTPRSMPVVPT